MVINYNILIILIIYFILSEIDFLYCDRERIIIFIYLIYVIFPLLFLFTLIIQQGSKRLVCFWFVYYQQIKVYILIK